MPDIPPILTKKIGPFPGWVWGLAVGAGVYFLVIRKGASGTSGTGSALGLAGPSGSTGIAGLAGPAGAAGDPGAVGAVGAQGLPGTPGAPGATGPPGSTQFPSFSQWLEDKGRSDIQAAIQRGDWQGLQGQYSKEAIAWAKANPGATGGATGGAGRSGSIGNRSLDPHAYFHPSMKAKIRYTHFVRGGGVGGAGHDTAIHQTAHVAGIHPARLQALNPVPHHGLIRVA